MGRFPVLMYHRILSPSCPIPDDDHEEARYAVDIDQFAWQLERLRALNIEAVSMGAAHERLERGEPVPDNWVVLTFDDGNHSDFAHARPLLSEHGFAATFFVSGERVGADGGLTPSMLKVMVEQGMEIGSHGMTHRFLTTLDAAEERDELARSQAKLSALIEREVEYFAPPGGRYARRTLDELRALSYRAVCTSQFGYNATGRPAFCYRRIPVMRSTTREQFEHFVLADTMKLLPMYVRTRSLYVVRKLLGESGYRRVRSLGVRLRG